MTFHIKQSPIKKALVVDHKLIKTRNYHKNALHKTNKIGNKEFDL